MAMGEWRACAKDTLAACFEQSASRTPDKPYFFIDERPVTFEQMAARSTSWANSLLSLGVGPGDRVAAMVENSFEIMYSWLACAKIGAIHVPIHTALRGELLRHQLTVTEPAAVLVDVALYDRLTAVAPESLRTVIVRTPAGADLPDPVGGLRVLPAEELLTADSSRLASAHTPRWDDHLAIFFTSGTTGPSKAAAMSNNYSVHMARNMVRNYRIEPGSIWYQPSALIHINAALLVGLVPIVRGSTGCTDTRFSVTRYWDRTRHYNASHISFLTFAAMLWKQPRRPDDLENPVRVASGTAIAADIHAGLEERFGLKIVKQYVLSENAATPIMSTVDDLAPPGTSGKESPDYHVVLLDENDEPVPDGVTGEIAIRPKAPYTMFTEYYNNPAATATAWRSGWFHTGDLGRRDADGLYTFVDRKKDYIRRRGENISSFELETVLQVYPDIAEIAAIGVPSELGEDEVKVCVVLQPDAVLEHTSFMDFCVDALPHYAVPRYVEVCDALPRNQTGRVLKPTLRERGIGDAWDREAAGYVVRRT